PLIRPHPTPTLFPYTTLFRSSREGTDHWRTDDMEARGNVVVVRDKDGGTMRTDVMTYNRVRNEVSSDKPFTFDAPDQHIKGVEGDRKSTRLNSSHLGISYAVF